MANRDELGNILRDEAVKKKMEADALKKQLADAKAGNSPKLSQKSQEQAELDAKAAQDRYNKWKEQQKSR